jgi:hypothetical protein
MGFMGLVSDILQCVVEGLQRAVQEDRSNSAHLTVSSGQKERGSRKC